MINYSEGSSLSGDYYEDYVIVGDFLKDSYEQSKSLGINNSDPYLTKLMENLKVPFVFGCTS